MKNSLIIFFWFLAIAYKGTMHRSQIPQNSSNLLLLAKGVYYQCASGNWCKALIYSVAGMHLERGRQSQADTKILFKGISRCMKPIYPIGEVFPHRLQRLFSPGKVYQL